MVVLKVARLVVSWVGPLAVRSAPQKVARRADLLVLRKAAHSADTLVVRLVKTLAATTAEWKAASLAGRWVERLACYLVV